MDESAQSSQHSNLTVDTVVKLLETFVESSRVELSWGVRCLGGCKVTFGVKSHKIHHQLWERVLPRSQMEIASNGIADFWTHVTQRGVPLVAQQVFLLHESELERSGAILFTWSDSGCFQKEVWIPSSLRKMRIQKYLGWRFKSFVKLHSLDFIFWSQQIQIWLILKVKQNKPSKYQ